MNQVNLFINGESRPAADGQTFERFGPLSGQAATVAAAGKAADANAAVEAAAKAFPIWAAMRRLTNSPNCVGSRYGARRNIIRFKAVFGLK